QEKVSALRGEKNQDGVPYKRATFSRHFKKVDDSTYQVTFHCDTARDNDTLLTEHFLVTLKKDPSSEKWKAASEDLLDSYSNLYRLVSSKAQFQKFASFSLSREGLKVSAGSGNL